MSDNQYDDSEKGGYSYEEKLAMVQKGLMDPKEIGLVSPTEAQQPPEPKLGDELVFICGEIPIGIRAHWARKELAVAPANPRGWEADWVEAHQNECLLGGRVRCGNMTLSVQRLVTDQVLGMIQLMRDAADVIEKKAKEMATESKEDA